MRKYFSLLFFAFLTAGCVKHVRHEVINGPDGKSAISMRCGNIPACLKAAGEMCPSGYQTLKETSEVSSGSSWGGGYHRGTKTTGTMLIRCNSK